MDDVDMGAAVEAEARAQAINKVRLNARNNLQHRGSCYNCEEPLDAQNFCNAECRDEYEELKRKQNIGRRM